MQEYLINERPLNDDTLYIADEGKCFKGNYKAILEYYTFANCWSDNKHIRRFRSLEGTKKFIGKRYPEYNLGEF